VGAVCLGVACRDCSLIETCGVIAEAEGQEIALAISLWSGESESLALASARRISGGEQCSPNSRKSPASRGFDSAAWEAGEKKPSTGRFFGILVEAAGVSNLHHPFS